MSCPSDGAPYRKASFCDMACNDGRREEKSPTSIKGEIKKKSMRLSSVMEGLGMNKERTRLKMEIGNSIWWVRGGAEVAGRIHLFIFRSPYSLHAAANHPHPIAFQQPIIYDWNFRARAFEIGARNALKMNYFPFIGKISHNIIDYFRFVLLRLRSHGIESGTAEGEEWWGARAAWICHCIRLTNSNKITQQ